MTIPPLSQACLDANPRFAKVWEHITTQLLEHDGSSRRANEARNQITTVAGPGLGTTPETEVDRDRVEDEDGSEDEDVDHGATQQRQRPPPPDFEAELHALRVRAMRREILWASLGRLGLGLGHREPAKQPVDRTTSRLPTRTHKHTTDHSKSDHSKYNGGGGGGGGNDDDGDGDGSGDDRDSRTSAQAQSTRPPTTKTASPELKELLVVVSAILSRRRHRRPPLPPDDRALLANDISRFRTHLPLVLALLSTHLTTAHTALTRLAATADRGSPTSHHSHPHSHPHTHPHTHSHTRPHNDNLAEHVARAQQRLSDHRTTLTRSLTALAGTHATLAALQRALLHTRIKALESLKHGAQSRRATARAAFLVAVSCALELKVRILVLETRRDAAGGEDVRAWVRARVDAIGVEEREVLFRRERVRGALDEYELVDPGLRVMVLLGGRYGELERERERVTADIERLRGGGVGGGAGRR